MPTNLAFDYALNGKPFMLARPKQPGPRAWQRTGYPDITARRSPTDVTYGNVPDTLDHPDVWDDWSGGFGDAYRRQDHPNGYHWSTGLDFRFPRQGIHAQAPQLLPARYASTRENADFFTDVPLLGVANPQAGAGTILILGRGYVASYTPTQYQNTAGSAFDIKYEATGGGALNFGHRPVVTGSYSFIPNTDGSGWYARGHDGADYTVADYNARWFLPAAGRIWFSLKRGVVRSFSAVTVLGSLPVIEANLPAGNAGPTLNLGNGIMVSQDAQAIENQVYVAFPDGAYQGNHSGTFNNVIGDIGLPLDADNCRDLAIYQGGLAVPAGPHIWWYKPSTIVSELREVGPSGLLSNKSAIRGRFTCVRGFGKWLYAGLFTGSGSYFMAGRDASPPLPYVWYPLHDFLGLNVKVSRIHVDGITVSSGGTRIPQRIWCATDASYGAQAGATAPVFWWPIPAGDANPLADLTFSPNYMGSARVDFAASDWGSPGTPKVFRLTETWADTLLSGYRYADIYHTVDEGARTLIGRAQTSPRSVLNLPAGVGSFIQGQSLVLSIESFTASANQTPVYRSEVVRGTLRPRSIDVITAQTRIATNMRDRSGKLMRTGAEQITDLRGFAAGTAPVLLTDISGAQSWVAVQVPVEEQEYYQEGSDEPELIAAVKMAVLDFSAA